MDNTLESKACTGCAKAKRRCGKQIPTCGRCQSRGLSCEYPSAKSFYLPPRRDYDPPARQAQATSAAIGQVSETPMATDLFLDMAGDSMAIDEFFPLDFDNISLPTPPTSLDPSPMPVSLPWFLEESSWVIENGSHSEPSPNYSTTVLMDHIGHMQEWQTRWVRDGSCPYIHHQIYRYQMPRCVQDAYTILSTYLDRTPENTVTVKQIIEQRIRQLLNEQSDDWNGDEANSYQKLNVFQHLSRVHALHVYQMIGLYDGDIRLRHVAETQIPTLNCWLRQLIQSAKSEAELGPESFIRSMVMMPEPCRSTQKPQRSASGLVGPNIISEPVSRSRFPRLSPEEVAWYAWALSETIRRIWIVATTMQTIYLTMQVRWAPCPGGAKFTTRADLWDSKSVFAWVSKCEESGVLKGVDFVSRQQWGSIFENRRPTDMDEFTQEVLDLTFGRERVERWRTAMAKAG